MGESRSEEFVDWLIEGDSFPEVDIKNNVTRKLVTYHRIPQNVLHGMAGVYRKGCRLPCIQGATFL